MRVDLQGRKKENIGGAAYKEQGPVVQMQPFNHPTFKNAPNTTANVHETLKYLSGILVKCFRDLLICNLGNSLHYSC